MDDLLDLLQKASKARTPRYRDRRGHYASGALSCLRDQYWALTGEPETDPTDFVGTMTMLVGKAVEEQLIKELISQLGYWGVMMRGTQVYVGGSGPNWDGSLDALLWRKDGGHHIIEIKTKHGFGADKLYKELEVSDDYLVQVGLYLRDLNRKGVECEGSLLYVLLSDAHFGKLLQVQCRYDAGTDSVRAYKARCSDGMQTALQQEYSLKKVDDNYRKLDKYVADKVVPPPTYKYKYDLTPEVLEAQSDYMLQRMIKGEKVLGDWQVAYSRYKQKQLQVDGIEPGYSEEELAVIRKEYRKRHPKSKI